jgi:hypothetical protein
MPCYQLVKRRLTFDRNEYVGAEEPGDGLELALRLRVVPTQGVVEIDRDVLALPPFVPVGEHNDAATQDKDVARWVVAGEQMSNEVDPSTHRRFGRP